VATLASLMLALSNSLSGLMYQSPPTPACQALAA
jgi:hypothetical protein